MVKRNEKPPDHEEKMLQAVALYSQGYSLAEAVEKSGVDATKGAVWGRYERMMGAQARDPEKAREEADQSLAAAAYAVAVPGMRQMAEELHDLPPEQRRGHVLAATRVLERQAGGPTGQQGWAQLLAKHLDALTAKIPDADPLEDAIDVTPDQDEQAQKKPGQD